MTISTWLIGSYPDLPQQDFTITRDGDAATPVTIDAGSYYLHHASGGLSLFDQLVSQMALASIAGANVRFLENRKIEIFGLDDFSITWPGDGLLRQILGFNGNLPGGSSSYIADNVSKYFWSGAKPMTWVGGPVNVLGTPVYDQQLSITPDGTIYSTGHYSLSVNEFSWRFVELDLYQTSTGAGGEYIEFFDTVLRRGRNFLLWWQVNESELTSPQVLPDAEQQGPYVMTGGRKAITPAFVRSAGFKRMNRRQDIDFAVVGAREYVNS